MELLVAYEKDPAGHNIAKFISQKLKKDGNVYRGKDFDLVIISSPVISADWLEEEYDYDGYIFLSKHAAESGVLALTCHNTGIFLVRILVAITAKYPFHIHIFKNHIFRIFGMPEVSFQNFK